ncbi:MAG: shikimate dehydrogenase [Methanocellales archaeon]|nr:shikimate dehydrogenase [Methanocellales archaeon]MDD3421502.1 shikimate dehydrogenase [Methanocellales archaeon]MDD4898803.1 shikimate dehydrogenase [Methanocellales archaeon]MDD5446619.1 shikimate dehydrogenase [Methanocellales archaeon]
MKKIYGVIGDPIEQSLSPIMHNAAFRKLGINGVYYAFRVSLENMTSAILGAKALDFGGLNVTIPLKERALDVVGADPIAKKIGAVNTIDFKDKIIGYNTDGIGAKRALEKHNIDVSDKSVLILGSGGAARAIAFQFAQDGATLVIANRTVSRAVGLAQEVRAMGEGDAIGIGLESLPLLIKKADILVNSTSVGMLPHTDKTLVTSDQMHSDLVVFDVVYNPIETRLLREAKKAGAITIDGVDMLVHQGAESFKIWTSQNAPIDVMGDAVRCALKC